MSIDSKSSGSQIEIMLMLQPNLQELLCSKLEGLAIPVPNQDPTEWGYNKGSVGYNRDQRLSDSDGVQKGCVVTACDSFTGPVQTAAREHLPLREIQPTRSSQNIHNGLFTPPNTQDIPVLQPAPQWRAPREIQPNEPLLNMQDDLFTPPHTQHVPNASRSVAVKYWFPTGIRQKSEIHLRNEVHISKTKRPRCRGKYRNPNGEPNPYTGSEGAWLQLMCCTLLYAWCPISEDMACIYTRVKY
ncbi:hypothetical protein DFH08DRAFT_802556 [Mycena albidolilacea]|uniref:Uncharacterized protein n=1 Tax=Mycena albidolilacea TaxID=1033008 RepID=A0AAD7AE59_9AGAR|nr:hypothetical protein DFH08DRAFT_802556 [Mycena albidolilacea]